MGAKGILKWKLSLDEKNGTCCIKSFDLSKAQAPIEIKI